MTNSNENMPDGSEKRADGGQQTDESLIQVMDLDEQTEPQSNSDRLRSFVDLHVSTPVRIAWADRRTRYGGAIILFFLLLGTFGVIIVPRPSINTAQPYLSPFTDWTYPFGTNQLGEPIGRKIVHATPAMLKLAAAGGLTATGLGVVFGTTAGYKGGATDRILMQITDIALTIPGLPLVILLAAIYQPENPFVVGVILAIDNWPGMARALRSQVLTIRDESYVEASRTIGIRSRTILGSDIVPQLMPYVLINGAGSARRVIFESVALYFLGLLPYSQINWGVMMNKAYSSGALSNLGRAGHWLIAPMIALMALSFGLILLSQGLDRVFNPRLRARHAKSVDSEEEQTIAE